jgi:hypothetical protein
VIDLLKGYFKTQDREDLREIRARVTGMLLTLDRSLAPMLALLDAPTDDAEWRTLDPGQRRQRTLDAVRRLLLREARERPVLLTFEDLYRRMHRRQQARDHLTVAATMYREMDMHYWLDPVEAELMELG